jgi:hypothetical protein
MKPEYDFSKAQRGKFYDKDATFNIPIYLDEEVLEYFSKQAEAKGVDLNDLLNALLRKDMDLIESVK